MNLNDFIKIAITVAVTAALTFNIQVSITNNNYAKLSDDVQDVKQTTETTDIKVNRTIEKLNHLGNTTQLSDEQILKIVKQILKEV